VVDTAGVNDEFQFGERAKRPARLGGVRAPRAGLGLDPRLLWLAVGLVVAGVLAWVFLRGADEAGKQLGAVNEQAVSQIDKAYDAAAQGTIGRAVVVAQSLHAEAGTFPTDAATLSTYDPGLHFTSGASTGPTSVSYGIAGSGFGAAVKSESGTCWWVRIDESGVTTYGSGTPCTGAAATSASSPTW